MRADRSKKLLAEEFGKTHPLVAATLATMLAACSPAPQEPRASNDVTSNDFIDTHVGKIELTNGYPSDASVHKLYDELDFQRAVQAYIWATPIVAMDALRIANTRDWGVEYNGVGIVDQYTSPAVVALTGNSTTIYAAAFMDLSRDGPVAVESPPGAYGVADDYWQRPVVEIGPFGPDSQGGKIPVLAARVREFAVGVFPCAVEDQPRDVPGARHREERRCEKRGR